MLLLEFYLFRFYIIFCFSALEIHRNVSKIINAFGNFEIFCINIVLLLIILLMSLPVFNITHEGTFHDIDVKKEDIYVNDVKMCTDEYKIIIS